MVGKILDELGAPFFCVDSLFEAYELYKAKIKTPILIMGATAPENLKVKKLPFSFAVFTNDMVDAIKIFQPHAPIHIFVDTGMHREGVPLEELPKFLAKCQGLKIEGLMTHLATIKNKVQLKKFTEVQKVISPKFIHPGNVWRLGRELYNDVLTFKATVTQIKELKKGDKVGYDFTFSANKKMRVAVVSAGYNDGVDRRLSNNPPFVGRISMNMCVVDLAKFPRAKVGDKIVLPINFQKLFPLEVLVHLNPTIKRVVVE